MSPVAWVYMEAARHARRLINKADHDSLFLAAAERWPVARLNITPCGLVSLNGLVGAAHSGRAFVAHRFADRHGHEPHQLVGDAERPLGADAPTCLSCWRSSSLNRRNPFRRRDVRPLHHRPNGDGEVLATLVALMQAGAVRLTRVGLQMWSARN